MSKLLTHLMLTASLMTGAVAYAAPDANPANMPAGSYVLEKTHASINAKVMHHGYAFYHFRFDKFDASYDYDPKNPTASKVVVTVDTKSMNTGYAKADKEFPVEFLAADKHPTATFKSNKITITQGNKGTMAGDLTLGGVTKPVTLDVVFNGAGKDMWGAMRSGFSATTTIKRSEFGLTKYVPAIGDEVALAIEVEFVKK
ncbi:MAG TPA: YceI family protein [Agitococcus sp.]|nr:YceI family protein [Agitococcus sp.]HNA20053.1 YceI family protein [Agitococcus sp.]HNC02689.1 YceI family protein [Agitococcus sp.]